MCHPMINIDQLDIIPIMVRSVNVSILNHQY